MVIPAFFAACDPESAAIRISLNVFHCPQLGHLDSDLLAGEDPVLSDADGNVMQNPLIAAAEEKDNKETRTLQANGGLTFKIIKGLTFRNNTGMRYQLYRRELFYGDQSIMGRRSGIYGSIRNTETGSFQTSNVLTYDKRFQKKHKVVVQLGQEFVKRFDKMPVCITLTQCSN